MQIKYIIDACRGGSMASHMMRSQPGMLQMSTLSHLENKVSCALALKSSPEFHFWLLTYTRYIVQEGV